MSKLKQAVIQARIDYMDGYTCLDCGDENNEAYFSHSGCDICHNFEFGGAGDVIDIKLYGEFKQDTGWTKEGDGQLCSGCICSIVNGDDSDLDYFINDDKECVR